MTCMVGSCLNPWSTVLCRCKSSPSEDPLHTGAYGKAVTEGFQGAVPVAQSLLPYDKRYVKIANMMK